MQILSSTHNVIPNPFDLFSFVELKKKNLAEC